MRLKASGGNWSGPSGGGSGPTFSGHRRFPRGVGIGLAILGFLLFIMCGKVSGPTQGADPTGGNRDTVSAAGSASSPLGRTGCISQPRVTEAKNGYKSRFFDPEYFSPTTTTADDPMCRQDPVMQSASASDTKTTHDGWSFFSVLDYAKRAVWQVAQITVLAMIGVAIPVGGWRIGYRWLDNRAQHVRLDTERGDAVARWEDAVAMATSTVEASNQAQLNRSKHPTPLLTHSQEVERQGPRNPPPVPPPPPLSCPGYEELREQQMFKPDRLLLGVSHGGPIYRVIKKHGSGYITALSGYGKSNEMAFLICQVLDQGGVVDLLDLHSVKDESLFHYLGPLANEQVLGAPMGLNAVSVKARLREIKAELYRMLDGGSDGRPRLIAADEGNALATHDDRELRMLFLDVAQLCAQQTRAFNVSMVAAIQHPTIQDLGGKTHGGAIRDCFGWSLCGKVPYKLAPVALRIAAANAPKDTEGLEPGEFYIVEGSRPEFLTTPLVTKADFVEVARARLSAERVSGVGPVLRPEPALRSAEPMGELDPTIPVEIAPTPPRRALVEDVDDSPEDPIEDRVIRAKAEGLKDIDIVRRFWGEKAASGRDYHTIYLPQVTGIMARVAQQYAGAASPLEGSATGEDDLMD